MATNASNNTDILDEYDQLTTQRLLIAQQRERLTTEMENVDRRLSEVREALRATLKGGSKTPLLPAHIDEGEFVVPTVRRRSISPKKTSTRTGRVHFDYKSKLADADPRVQRSMGELFRFLERTQVRTTDVATASKRLKISREAARLRLARGVQLGLLKKVGPAKYEATI